MATFNEQKKNIKSKIDVIKNINDTPSDFLDSQKDKLSAFKPFGTKTLDSYLSKINLKKEIRIDVFSELMDTVEGFLNTAKPPSSSGSSGSSSKKSATDKKSNIDIKEKASTKQRLRQITEESIQETVKSAKTIVIESVSQVLFAGNGICGDNKSFTSDTLTISPTEFDFLNVLTVDPSSNSGQIVYESLTDNPNSIKMNRILYSGFSGTEQTITTKDGKVLFKLNWDSSAQHYVVTGLQGINQNAPTQIKELISDYYSNIQFADYNSVLNTAILMVTKGDGSESPLFDVGLNDLNRLLSKICSNCGNPSEGLKQTQQFNENDEQAEFYFDFDDVEGIDLDDEADRLEKVLRFRDCNEFIVPINPTHFEDFVIFSDRNINDNISNTLYNMAADAHNQTDDTIPVDNFHISLVNSYITALPKALMGCVLAPKYFLPVVMVYKQLVSAGGAAVTSVKLFMSKLNKLFKMILEKLMWKFLAEAWKRIKKDLADFLKVIAAKIILNKYKKYVTIVTSLIAILNNILQNLGDLDNCNALYNTINKAIQLALTGGASIPIPSPLLLAAASRDGYSADRAHMNAMEGMKGRGINTGDKFGVPSQIGPMIHELIKGQAKEQDTNGKVSVYGINPLAGPSFGISH